MNGNLPKFNEGDMVQLSGTMVIPDFIRYRNLLLNDILNQYKRPDFSDGDYEFGIIVSSMIAENYIGYIWFSQKRLQYYLVFEEELKKI